MAAGIVSPAKAESTSPGQLYAFGNNATGSLGVGVNAGNPLPNWIPALVGLQGANGPVTQLASSGGHSLAITSTGQLYTFGLDSFGQLGAPEPNGLFDQNPNSIPMSVGLPGAVVQIAAGAEHSLAVTSTGQLFSFGNNKFGQLGIEANDETSAVNLPSQVTLPGASGAVTQIAAGEEHSLVVTSTGQLYSFGLNESGQLGHATGSGKRNSIETPEPAELPAGTLVTQAAAGGNHSLAITSTGQLYSFGDNNFGQLGTQEHSGTSIVNQKPSLVSLPGASGPVTQIAAGKAHSLAVTSTGQLYAFGENQFGELGFTQNEIPNWRPTLVSLPGATGPVVQIAAGEYDSLAVTSTGQLYAFGENRYGQLGIKTNSGTESASPTPALVPLPVGTTIDTVARGVGRSSLVLVADMATSTATLPGGEAAVPYGAVLQARGGTPPYTWAVSGLPAGLALNPATGQITGTPVSAASSSVTFTVTDVYGISASSAAIALTVVPDNGGTAAPAALLPVPDSELVSRALVASSSGAVTLKVRCPAGESSCSGTVTLTVVAAAARAAKRHGAPTLTIAVGSFRVAGGHVTTVRLHLSTKARALLARKHVLKARATLVARDRAGRRHTTRTAITIRLG